MADNGKAIVKRRATLHDVAEAAGVSIATVSNLINGKFDLMSAETREGVERAIKAIGYRPSASGRNLRSALSRVIGLIIVDDNPSFLTDTFNSMLVAGLSNVLSVHDHGVVVVGMDEKRLEKSFLIRNDETDALAIIPSGTRRRRFKMYDLLIKLNHPLVVFQDDPSGSLDPAGDVLVIRQDDREAGRILARRLIERGARSILFLQPTRIWPAIEQRIAGIELAIAESGLSIDLERVHCGREDMADTLAAIGRHVGERGLPDAIMAGNDRMGIAALRWARSNQIDVPGRLKVTGFNAFEFREYSTPILTSVRSDAYAMGEAGARALLARLRGGQFGERDIVFPVALVDGDSDTSPAA